MDRQDAKTPRTEPEPELDALARLVIDAAFEVHKVLGPGYGEMVYESALCVELALRGEAYERQPTTVVEYKGHCVGEGRMDFDVALLKEGIRRVVLSPSPGALAPWRSPSSR